MHTTVPSANAILCIERLRVEYRTPDGPLVAVQELTLQVRAGECVGIVGESGAGKSQSFLAIMGLLGRNATVSGGATLQGRNLLSAKASEARALRGARIAMIFQDPMTSLTPHLRVGDQIAESLVCHRGFAWADARARAVQLLRRVQVTDPQRRVTQYPHELSGGMRQRVMIAIALACDPVMLIADEPTTALDVTIQAQILQLLAELKRDQGMAMTLITHDLGVIAGIADRVIVMYAGRVVEAGDVQRLLTRPQHPYTDALLRSMPRVDAPADTPLVSIAGQPPNPRTLPSGCAFHPRCRRATVQCRSQVPPLRELAGEVIACHHPLVDDEH